MSDSFATLWTVARQASLPMRFSRQEYLSGLPFPSPDYLQGGGIKPESPALAGGFFTTELLGKPIRYTRDAKNMFTQANDFTFKHLCFGYTIPNLYLMVLLVPSGKPVIITYFSKNSCNVRK